jgi:steroid 5-alpha reductase family enzyme
MTVLYLEALVGIARWPIAGEASSWRQRLLAGLVTGIPSLEAQMTRSRGARYRDHQFSTSAFFPLRPHQGVVT